MRGVDRLRFAIASWENGGSRVIDSKAIGGSGGWKRIAQGWAGENATSAIEPASIASRVKVTIHLHMKG